MSLIDSKLEAPSPDQQRKSRRAARELQRQKFNRNQALGILLIALVIVIYRVWRTPSGWIFPAGWWRLW